MAFIVSNRLIAACLCFGLSVVLVGCGSDKPPRSAVIASNKNAVRIKHISQREGGQELMLHGMSLIGTPYVYGGSSRQGFDCSGMVQYLYRQALGVSLPRTAKNIAAASQHIRQSDLQVGDLVFFNTTGQPFSHVGLYIGNDQFIHAPSSKGVIRTENLSQSYFKRRFTGAYTLFAR